MSESFFQSLESMPAAEACTLCDQRAKDLKRIGHELRGKLAATLRGDKATAHELRRLIALNDTEARRLKPIRMNYWAAVRRNEQNSMWKGAVLACCGQEKLSEVFAWMQANWKRRGAQNGAE